MPLENISHIQGRKRFRCTINSSLELTTNTVLNNLFSTNCHLSFMIDTQKANEVIFSKGHPVDPSQGSWAIINEDKYLKFVLHDSDNVHSLVFKTSDQVLNTRKRKMYSLNFDATSKLITFFVNGIETPVVNLLNQSHYVAPSSFTGIRNTSDSILVGKGLSLGFGEFSIYYDLCVGRKLSASEINSYYQTIYDTRVLPEIGKIVFYSLRPKDGSTAEVLQMNEEGTSLETLATMNYQYRAEPCIYSDNGQNIGYIQKYNAYEDPGAQVLKYKLGSGSFATVSTNTIYRPRDFSFNDNTNEIFVGRYVNGPDQRIGSFNPQTQAFSSIDPIITDPSKTHGRFSYNSLLNKIAYVKYQAGVTASAIWIYDLNTDTESQIFSLANLASDITLIRWNKQGTKIGFNAYFGNNNTDYRACIMNADGSDIEYLGYVNSSFWAFSPDGLSVLLSRNLSSSTYTNKDQLIIRNIASGQEINITNHDSNNIYADWKA